MLFDWLLCLYKALYIGTATSSLRVGGWGKVTAVNIRDEFCTSAYLKADSSSNIKAGIGE